MSIEFREGIAKDIWPKDVVSQMRADDEDWKEDVWELICDFSKEDYPPGEGFNADDMCDVIGEPYEISIMGGFFFKAKRLGIIEVNGHRLTRARQERKGGRRTPVYKGTPERLALRKSGWYATEEELDAYDAEDAANAADAADG